MPELVGPHPIKEFNEELESADRRCLFCKTMPPNSLRTREMTWQSRKRVGWYSNAGLKDGVIARFYVCDRHFDRIPETWEWLRQGFTKVSAYMEV